MTRKSSAGLGGALTARQRRLVEASVRIADEAPNRSDFLHTVMCQVGLPRSQTDELRFERRNGHISILLEAGKLFNGRHWVQQPLPYGSTPRLVMVHVSSEAIRTQSRSIEIGDSMRSFLTTLGMTTSGGARGGYTTLRRQMEALAACRLTIGMFAEGQVVTRKADPIEQFTAWLDQDGTQPTLWPGSLELTQDFYNTLLDHAVPLDYRALAALKHSALALDVYTWLAHRLCRVKEVGGVKLSWQNLLAQFGQEYADTRNFKHEFKNVLRQVLLVYPEARVEEVEGGLKLFPSRPPLSQTQVSLALPPGVTVDKPEG
ncbi:MAG: replication protein RepA [Tepidisphaeraceae bacterium]